ncbi:MAG: hypothetical protein WBW99_19435, partial [Pseudolabrys sp.]
RRKSAGGASADPPQARLNITRNLQILKLVLAVCISDLIIQTQCKDKISSPHGMSVFGRTFSIPAVPVRRLVQL